ncbi:hypothetical protein TraAM80_05040 [Trypanosoma rangeli]|uniref:Uncharacterized protein n=1 Tax=Trypanosoma rangeli TaxID=5698 RepID=A0A422NGV8_TRYRA|nr:uncharacterized protein TraAM80_05040 [Trypanosoma rangeli]RNF04706.1 hypothetical protein TraAM80_05040 [Trypanosoma rangeli]|eukprot:RNF04706.1 hypothetical protein TraAM80_05040 [Trypanosoma rangeli]
MSHVTADLEYFKCDMCGVYLHKDIFCDHRRECKGLDSTEMKKSQCRQIELALDEETRRRLASRAADGATFVPVELAERHQHARVRRNVVNLYQAEVDKALQQQLAPDKMKSLAAFLRE